MSEDKLKEARGCYHALLISVVLNLSLLLIGWAVFYLVANYVVSS